MVSARFAGLSHARTLALAGGCALTAALATSIGFAAPASAATHARPAGHVRTVHVAHGRVSVSGWALDRSRPPVSTSVTIVINGRTAAHVRANGPSGGVDAAQHVTGRHNFHWSGSRRHVHRVVIIARPATRGAHARRLATRRFPSAATLGARIVREARRFVGNTPYVWGGTTPRGFDCSGYAQYVYKHAGAPALPRTAEQQRRADRRISRRQARPGDEVFYLRNGSAYHVAIYAGHGMEFSAATPREGIRYDHVWSPNVHYGTNWH